MPVTDHAAPSRGNERSIESRRFKPVAAIRLSAALSIICHIAGDTTPPPKFDTTATRKPFVGIVPSAASHPETRGRLSGSWPSCPLAISNQRAVSRTLRARQPVTVVKFPFDAPGPRGMRPKVAFNPTRPLNPAGIRIDPPPSPPVAIETSPPATAAALPPEEPPGVWPCFHGLCVAPCKIVRVTFTPPNSLAVVCPTFTAPPTRQIRFTCVSVVFAIRSLNTMLASVSGQPETESSSFTPNGTPPNGNETSAFFASRSADSRSRKQNAFRSLFSIAAYVALNSSRGE